MNNVDNQRLFHSSIRSEQERTLLMDSELVVQDIANGNGGAGKECFSYGHVPLRELESADSQSFEAVVELLSPLANNFIGKILREDFTESGTYIQDVIVFSDSRERSVLNRFLSEQGTAFGRDLFGFSFDDDHCHILHSCAFSSGQCKCRWRKEIPCGKLRPGYRGRRQFRQLGRSDLIAIVLYFFYKKGGNKEAWIKGRCQRLEDNCKYGKIEISNDFSDFFILIGKRVQWSQVEEELGRILGVSNSQTGLDLSARESDGEFSEPVNKRSKRNDGFQKGGEKNQRRKTKWEIISQKVEQLLERTAICPLEGIKSEECFLNDMMLTDPDNSTKVSKAIEVWSHKINCWSLRQFYEMYMNSSPEHLIFSRSKDYFTDFEESTKVLDDLLKYQFDDEESRIVDFLQQLVNVVDRQPQGNPGINIKTNTFCVYSEPSAGKNFFFDTLFTLLLSFGQLGTANKHNNFAFQDAPNRRIILWNEPNYESSMTDYLKTLFEGGDTKVRVKMMGDTHVKRTPIVILTNNHVGFMSDPAFEDRIKQYKWKSAPFLKDYKFKPYPLSFFDILLKYKIKF